VGLTGSLKAVMANGKQFKIGSGMDDAMRAHPPEVGSIVTCLSSARSLVLLTLLADRFQELTQAGVPRFPTFVGERIDKSEPEDAVVRVKEA
jgi:DNA ligase-1